jgi:hypothetical protein
VSSGRFVFLCVLFALFVAVFLAVFPAVFRFVGLGNLSSAIFGCFVL